MIAENAQLKGTLKDIVERARVAEISVERVSRKKLEKQTQGAHQGVVAEAESIPKRTWKDGLSKARESGETPLLVAIDGVEDPHNLGAILRTAEVFGAHAVILPKRRSAPMSPLVRKAAAGATEHLVIDVVTNLERTLAACKDEGCWIVALAEEAPSSLEVCDLLEEPVVIVVGSEGEGVSHLVKQRADALVRIETKGQISSLNASVAAAICLWEAAKKRK